MKKHKEETYFILKVMHESLSERWKTPVDPQPLYDILCGLKVSCDTLCHKKVCAVVRTWALTMAKGQIKP